MKTILLKIKILAILLISYTSYNLSAQIPEKFSYQAVVRKDFELLKNQNVAVQISLFKDHIEDEAVYIEQHLNRSTNINGLLILEIGNGTVIKGNFANIDWNQGTYYIESKINPDGIPLFTGPDIIAITTQAFSVPYALYSKTALTAVNIANPNENINTILYLPKIHNVTLKGTSLSSRCMTTVQAFGSNTTLQLYYGLTEENYSDTVLFETTAYNFRDYKTEDFTASILGLAKNKIYYYLLKII